MNIEWISVKDKLPEALYGGGDYQFITKDVLTYSKEHGIVKGYFNHDESCPLKGWHSTDSDYETGDPCIGDANVTHWIILPEPKEQSDAT